jgi:hypothetical protein
MHYQLSAIPGRFHELFVAAINPSAPATPEVCLQAGQKPSIWAKQALNFEAEPKQLEVLDHDGHRLILCCPRQWGKSTLIALKALHYSLNHPHSEIVVLSDTEDHAGIIVQKIITYAAALKIPQRRARGKQYSVELPNGARIFAVASTTNAVVGYTANVVIVDEAALVEDEVIGYLSRSLSRTNGKMWLLSTPRGQTGLFFAIWHDESNNWHRVKATIADAKYMDVAFIQEQKRLFPATFRQDFHCEFLQAAGRLFTIEKLKRCVDPSLNNRGTRFNYKDNEP